MQYTEKVLDHFSNPRNVGEIKDADGIGEVGNPVCGDMMTFYIKVSADGKRLEDVKFKTFGCGAAIAVSSMISEMAKGKTLDEAAAISKKDVADQLGGLPPHKMHCSNLGTDALQKAIDDYKSKAGKKDIKKPAAKTEPVTHEQDCSCPFCAPETKREENHVCKPCAKEVVKCPSCGKLYVSSPTGCPECKK